MNTEIEKIYSGDELDKFIIKMSDLLHEALLEMNKEQTVLPDIVRKNISSISNMLAKYQIRGNLV